MCGRFTLTLPDGRALAAQLGAVLGDDVLALYRPRYNIAPGTQHPVLIQRGGRLELTMATWGFVPRWQRGKPKVRPINARSETARASKMFAGAAESRRCLVPADGFFEWTGPKNAKKPLWFHAPGPKPLLLFAGLEESYHLTEDQKERTFTILTTPANELVRPVHDRMPAVLTVEEADRWFYGDDPWDLLRPTPSGALTRTEVSTRVNSVANDDPSCLLPPGHEGAASLDDLPLFARR